MAGHQRQHGLALRPRPSSLLSRRDRWTGQAHLRISTWQHRAISFLHRAGYGCWDLAELFAALAPICGGGDEAQAQRLAAIPIWAFHGADDAAVPVIRSQRMISAIRAAGRPRYSELEGVGHNSWTPAYSDPEGLIPWIFELVRAEP